MKQMSLFPETTVVELKAFLKENYKKGCVCGACNQPVRLYSRPITSAMAYGLILMYKSNRTGYTHVQDFFKKTQNIPSSIHGDFPKLRYWGLIEASKITEGLYRITREGEDFILSLTTVKSHALLYNNRCYGLEGSPVNIKDCLKNKFDLDKLLAGTL